MNQLVADLREGAGLYKYASSILKEYVKGLFLIFKQFKFDEISGHYGNSQYSVMLKKEIAFDVGNFFWPPPPLEKRQNSATGIGMCPVLIILHSTTKMTVF